MASDGVHKIGKEGGNWRDLVKVVGVAAGLRMLWGAYQTANNLTWKSASESAMYSHWVAFCQGLVEKGIVPEYLALDPEGRKIPVPSPSPMPFKEPPTRVADAKILQPLKLRGLTIRNRVVRAAAFDGETEQEYFDTHIAQAQGGVGMTTVAYCCVSHDGKTFDDQLVMSEDRRGFLTRLADAVHEHGAAISAQLTHGGSFADSEAIAPAKQMAPSSVFAPSGMNFPRAMTTKDLDKMLDDFAFSARLAKETGFDCLELHCGHGYLLSQFLSPSQNVRTDKYGGSAEKRAEFPAQVLRRCRAEVGEDFPIIVKLNMHDGMNGGLEINDATVAAKVLRAASADGFVMTGGFVSQNGFYMLRGNTPQDKLVQALPHTWKKIAVMIFGPLAVPPIEYEDCFFRDGARHIMKELGPDVPVCLMGGVNSFSEMEGAMDEGFGFVQIARGLIREPDLVNRITATLQLKEKGLREDVSEDIESSCVRCNMCVLASVNPAASFGCPFQRMDAKRRAAQDLPAVFSVEQMENALNPVHQAGLEPNPVSANTTLRILPSKDQDIEDIEDMFIRAPRSYI